VYTNWPVDAALRGCNDDSVSLDHRDPTHPVRNIIKLMYHLRKTYSVLQDGFNLQSVAKSVHDVFLPGSYGTPTVTGIWSVVRNHLEMLQQPEGGNQSVWLVYHNEDHQVKYNLDCTHNDTAFIAPFPEGTTVKNILAPYEEFELQKGPGKKLFIDKSQEVNGCAQELTLDAWGFKAYVPKKAWIKPPPFLTSFHPGHDARLRSTPELDVELHFSEKIDCDDVTASITISSKTKDGSVPKLDTRNIACQTMPPSKQISAYIASTWRWKARLTGVADGIHTFTLKNTTGTDTIDHLMVRVGQPDNPVVFSQDTTQASHAYIRDSSTGDLTVIHTAAGADSWRYSTNWGSLWSPWLAYAGGNTTITELPWSGTHSQRWSGHHVILQYWSQKAGSIHIQHADATDRSAKQPRRFPHLFTHGTYNMFGYDGGLPTRFTLDAATGVSKFHLSTEWPTEVQLNVWGTNPDGKPDQTFVYGDVDEDKVLDRVLPDSLSPAVLNITDLPPSPHLAYRIEVHENRLRYELVPAGSRIVQIIFFSLLWVLPILTGTLATWIYMGAFYKIKFNKIGNRVGGTMGFFRKNRTREKGFQRLASGDQNDGLKLIVLGALRSKNESSLTTAPVTSKRRCILIATLEYDIEDWGIKIKIGGLGVMAQLMGKALTKQDLIWVVPCVGGIDYPIDQVAPPMRVCFERSPPGSSPC
jgi:alpha-1,3-glucan synthase